MIDNILNLIFRCPHHRLTRPITPVHTPGASSDGTYVVCLDCGKQFSYDWSTMRVGKQVRASATAGVLRPDMPKPPGSKLKYAVFASGMLLIGKALWPKRRDRGGRTGGTGRGQAADH